MTDDQDRLSGVVPDLREYALELHRIVMRMATSKGLRSGSFG